MRRRLLWIIPVFAILLASALLIPPPGQAPAFEFLKGRPEFPVPTTSGELPQDDVAIYTFKADYKSLNEAAVRELVADGYKIDYDSKLNSRYLQGSPRDAWQSVWIDGDMRCVNAQRLYGGPPRRLLIVPMLEQKNGWVTVTVRSTNRPSLLARLKSWLGM